MKGGKEGHILASCWPDSGMRRCHRLMWWVVCMGALAAQITVTVLTVNQYLENLALPSVRSSGTVTADLNLDEYGFGDKKRRIVIDLTHIGGVHRVSCVACCVLRCAAVRLCRCVCVCVYV